MIARISEDDVMNHSESQYEIVNAKSTNKSRSPNHWYSVPVSVRRVFNKFPLRVYRENGLPQRARRDTTRHALYIFKNVLDVSAKELSCNPTCLKWQAYLKINDIDFAVVASNNHSSPSGSLPFILPASSKSEASLTPLTTGKIPRWVAQQTMQEDSHLSMEQEAYIALVDQNIRGAWLYHLYLDKSNFDAVAHPLYVSTSTSNIFAQLMVAYQLRQAAQSELLKNRKIIDRDEVFLAARKAFSALSTLLSSNQFFSREDRPGLFDASVFAYTHLLLDESLPWADTSLPDMLQEHPRLMSHRERLLEFCTRR